MLFSRLFFFTACLLAAVPSFAHEFWIEAHKYQVAPGEFLQADFKNGEEFKGPTLSYFDRNSARFDMITPKGQTALKPRSGDAPALNVAAPQARGLVVIVHESTPSTVTYRSFAKFLKFADHKDFPQAAQDHLAAGWPRQNFKESYTRHVKALMAVGDGEGEDRSTGMATEFVALTNPYAATFNNRMKVMLTFDGAPRPDAQVEVFERAPDGTVTVTLEHTDASGRADVAVKSGHEYLFDAVVLRPRSGIQDPAAEPVWETFWAALTFAVPQ